MCTEQCTFQMSSVVFLGPQNATKSLVAGASLQTPMGELTTLHQTPQPGLSGQRPTLRPVLLSGVEGKGWKGEGAKLIYAPKSQKPSRCHCSSKVGQGAPLKVRTVVCGGHNLKLRHWLYKHKYSYQGRNLQTSDLIIITASHHQDQVQTIKGLLTRSPYPKTLVPPHAAAVQVQHQPYQDIAVCHLANAIIILQCIKSATP